MNVYGPFMGFGLVHSVLQRIAGGLPPVINGDGSQSFDFVYVDDVAGATVQAMAADVSDETFNVGSGEEKTVRDVVFALLELAGSPLQPEFRPVQVPMVRRVGSSEKAAASSAGGRRCPSGRACAGWCRSSCSRRSR